MTLDGARLEISADVNNDGATETGTFRMQYGLEDKQLEIVDDYEPKYLIGGVASQANAIFSGLTGSGDAREQEIFKNLGGGRRLVQIQFQTWQGSSQDWGDGTNDVQADATGADARTQKDVLLRYLIEANHDSFGNTTLHYHEWSTEGVYSPLNVAVIGRNLRVSSDDPVAISGNITFAHAADLDQAVDGVERTG